MNSVACAAAIIACLLFAYAAYHWQTTPPLWRAILIGVFAITACVAVGAVVHWRGARVPGPLGAYEGGGDTTLNPRLKIVDYMARDTAGKQKTLRVIRDDLLCVGTKQRAIIPYLKAVMSKNDVKTILYTAPFNGYSPVAAALGARELGIKAHLVLSLRPFGGGKAVSAEAAANSIPVKLARAEGAFVEFTPDWESLVARGVELEKAPGTLWLPLGMDEPDFNEQLAGAIRAAAVGTPLDPSNAKGQKPRIWVAGGSGVISAAIARGLPHAEILVIPIELQGKSLMRLRETSSRVPNMKVEARHGPEIGTPYPSVSHYDVRAWEYAVEWGRSGDFVWNVAGEEDPPVAAGRVRAIAIAADAPPLDSFKIRAGETVKDCHRRINDERGPLSQIPAPLPSVGSEPPLPRGVSIGPEIAAGAATAIKSELTRLFSARPRGVTFRRETSINPTFAFFPSGGSGQTRLSAAIAGMRKFGCGATAKFVEERVTLFLRGLDAAGAAAARANIRLFVEMDEPGDGYRWHIDSVADDRNGPIHVATFGAPTVFDFVELAGDAGKPARIEAGDGAAFTMDGQARVDWTHGKPHVSGVRYNLVFEFPVLPGAAVVGDSALFGVRMYDHAAR